MMLEGFWKSVMMEKIVENRYKDGVKIKIFVLNNLRTKIFRQEELKEANPMI